MTNYDRYPTTTASQLDRVRDAYALAGAKEPSRALDIAKIINGAPTAEQVTNTLALAALTATNAEEFYQDAIAQIRDAHAGDALRATFAARLEQHSANNMPQIIARAVEDINPAVGKLIAQFEAAAKKLPDADPLDITANVENDTATEYKTAKAALTALGKYASMYVPTVPGDVPANLNRILPVVNIPDATTEQVIRGLHRLTANEQQMSGTRAIRALAEAAHEDIDTALIDVARGDYEGISISLATPEENTRRRKSAVTAYTTQTVESGNSTMVMR